MDEWDKWDNDWSNLFQGTSGKFNPNNRYGFSEDYATSLRDSTLYSNPLTEQSKALSSQQGFPGATTYSLTDGGLAGMFGDSVGGDKTSKSYFGKLLDGDRKALGLAEVGLKGLSMAADLAMLPSMLENAKWQNKLTKQAYTTNKYKFDNHAKVTDQLSKISVA